MAIKLENTHVSQLDNCTVAMLKTTAKVCQENAVECTTALHDVALDTELGMKIRHD